MVDARTQLGVTWHKIDVTQVWITFCASRFPISCSKPIGQTILPRPNKVHPEWKLLPLTAKKLKRFKKPCECLVIYRQIDLIFLKSYRKNAKNCPKLSCRKQLMALSLDLSARPHNWILHFKLPTQIWWSLKNPLSPLHTKALKRFEKMLKRNCIEFRKMLPQRFYENIPSQGPIMASWPS